jgi:hypothetical protein
MLERPFWYAGAFSLSANQTQQDLRIGIRSNADFFMRGLGMFNASQAVGGRFRRADSAWFTGSEFLHLTGFLETAGFARPTVIYPQIRYPKDSAFIFDLTDLGGAGDATIYPVLFGVERYEDGALPAAALPARYVGEDHKISVVRTITGLDAKLFEIPIKCQTGDAFAIRWIRWTVTGTAPTTMHFRLWDSHGMGFQNDWVPLNVAIAAGSNNNANQPYPGIQFPEMVIPADGAYTLDLWNRTEAGPFTVELTFGGVKLVEVAGS